MMMIHPCARKRWKKFRSGGGGGRDGRSKKGRIDGNSDARRGRSHRSNSVRDVGMEEQEKTWTVVSSYNPSQNSSILPLTSFRTSGCNYPSLAPHIEKLQWWDPIEGLPLNPSDITALYLPLKPPRYHIAVVPTTNPSLTTAGCCLRRELSLVKSIPRIGV